MHLKRKTKELIKNGKLARVIKKLKQGSRTDQPKTTKKGETFRKDKPLEILMVQSWQSVARLRPKAKNQMVLATTPLIGFIRSLSLYNGIIGRPGVRQIQAVPSTSHGMLKFSVPGEVLTLQRSKIISLECMMVSRPGAQPFDVIQIAEEKIKIAIHPEYPEQTIAIGSTITEEGRKALCDLLRHILDNRGGRVLRIQSEYQGNNGMSKQAKAAFKEMKKLIAKLPTLTAPMDKEELIMYLAAVREGILLRPEVAGRLQKWSNKLDDSLNTPMEAEEELPNPWTLFTDESSRIDGSKASLILTNTNRAEFTYALRFRFDATSNEAEYEALVADLRIVEQMGVKNLQANIDSRLVANQVLVKGLKKKSINEAKVLAVMEEERDTSMTPIYNYLMEETLLAEKEKARVIRRKSEGYVLINGIDELPLILWAHLTMIKLSNGDTLFSVTHEMQAVIPAKIGIPTIRTAKVDMVQNDEALEINLDILEERREQEAIHEVKSKAKMEKYSTLKSATQALNLEISYTGIMRPTMQKRAGSLALSAKDHMK
uniref:Reverse transcriptase domain-containing protein n=1 Tax=Tanacetum cinerariifolium TaxID=118510 RepID=A0A6L2K7G5_TANCI|nr:reverse transcriptase domain-containing protein [Tanacetum cinerariifolium]